MKNWNRPRESARKCSIDWRIQSPCSTEATGYHRLSGSLRISLKIVKVSVKGENQLNMGKSKRGEKFSRLAEFDFHEKFSPWKICPLIGPSHLVLRTSTRILFLLVLSLVWKTPAGSWGSSNSLANSIGIGSATGECLDYKGQTIQHEMHFVPPGVDMCKRCICENGHAKVRSSFA